MTTPADTRHARLASAVFAVLLAATAWRALTGDLELHGDGREYVIQTQSIVFNHRLSIDAGPIREYWNRTNPYGQPLADVRPAREELAEETQSGGDFGGLYPDRFGGYRYYHFWLYSLLVAPLYALLHAVSPGAAEYHAFRAMNTLFLLLPFLVAWRRGRGWPLLIVTGLMMLTPLLPYVDWQHSELMCFCFVMLALQTAGLPRWRGLGPVLLGLAATQNPPIILFLPLHFALMMRNRPSRIPPVALAYAAGAAAFGLSLLYSRWYFGVWNVIEAIGLAKLAYASVPRALHIFFSPLNGALWFFPAAFLVLPSCLRRDNALFVGLALLLAFAAAWLASSTANFNAGQVGSARYTVWILAPLVFAVTHGPWLPGPSLRAPRAAVFAAGVALNLVLVAHFQTQLLANKDIRRFGGSWRARPEVARIYRFIPYPDDVETLVENIRGRELPIPRHFNGLYAWDLGGGRSLWIISARLLRDTRGTTWPDNALPRYTARPPNDVFEFRDGVVRLAPEKITGFVEHPVLGGYVEVRMQRAVPEIVTDMPLFIAR